MSGKEALVSIIKNQGDTLQICNDLLNFVESSKYFIDEDPCDFCPISYKNLCLCNEESADITYQLATELFVNKYGKAELVEVLL